MANGKACSISPGGPTSGSNTWEMSAIPGLSRTGMIVTRVAPARISIAGPIANIFGLIPNISLITNIPSFITNISLITNIPSFITNIPYAGDEAVLRCQAAVSECPLVFPHGRLLRNVLRGRAGRGARARAHPHVAIEGFVGSGSPDVRGALSRRRHVYC